MPRSSKLFDAEMLPDIFKDSGGIVDRTGAAREKSFQKTSKKVAFVLVGLVLIHILTEEM